MKTAIKNLDVRLGGTLRRVYLGLRRLLALPAIWRSRARVGRAVGSQLLRQVAGLRVVAFPNRVRAATSLGQRGYAIEKILLVCGLDAQAFEPAETVDLCLNWQDLTTNLVDTRKYLQASREYAGIEGRERPPAGINFDCRDISKATVGRLHGEIFGYELDVDPTAYTGRAACKSDDNSKHDGQVIQCPIGPSEVRPGMVYNVLVNNTEGDYAVDFRLIYIGGLVEFFYEKRRPLSDRFSNTNSVVALRPLGEEFTAAELERIEAFCRRMGADYGELDVLRDIDTRRLYVVDFAKTPAGPPNGLPAELAQHAIEGMSVAFIKNILAPLVAKGEQAGA